MWTVHKTTHIFFFLKNSLKLQNCHTKISKISLCVLRWLQKAAIKEPSEWFGHRLSPGSVWHVHLLLLNRAAGERHRGFIYLFIWIVHQTSVVLCQKPLYWVREGGFSSPEPTLCLRGMLYGSSRRTQNVCLLNVQIMQSTFGILWFSHKRLCQDEAFPRVLGGRRNLARK